MNTAFDAIADRYEVSSLLGEGGFGAVYKARQRSTGQLVAIKVLHTEKLESAQEAHIETARFEREMRTIAELQHPHIVQLLDAGNLGDGRRFTVLEYIEGEELERLIQRTGPLAPREAARLMAQVLDALSAAHGIGVVHRDLKPANIMVTQGSARRNAMVLDFGIAGVIEAARTPDYETLTAANRIHGTPAYMAPEQLRAGTPTPQFDLYAWGLTFIKCLVGRNVVHGDSLAGLIMAQVSPQPVAIPPEVLALPFGRVIARAVEKDPAKRYKTALQVLDELDAAIASSPHGRAGSARPAQPDDLIESQPLVVGACPPAAPLHELETMGLPPARLRADGVPDTARVSSPVAPTPVLHAATPQPTHKPGSLPAGTRAPRTTVMAGLGLGVVLALLVLAVSAFFAARRDSTEPTTSSHDETASSAPESQVEAPLPRPTLDPPQEETDATRPATADRVWVPGGALTMGARVEQQMRDCRAVGAAEPLCTAARFGGDAAGPRKERFHGFWIDRNEVDHGAWARCVEDGACQTVRWDACSFMAPDARFEGQIDGAPAVERATAALGAANLPVVCVSRDEAAAFCAWAGARLPSEVEWQAVASNRGRTTYPWGDELDRCGRANQADSALALAMGWRAGAAPILLCGGSGDTDNYAFSAPVDTFGAGANTDGVLNLAGNVREWTSSTMTALEAPDDVALAVVRGGGWADVGPWIGAQMRAPLAPLTRRSDLGLRCVQEVRKEP